jgi:myo-inositol-1(or 4)-monophosphatase
MAPITPASNLDPSRLLDAAVRAAESVAERLARSFHDGSVVAERKDGHHDVVTGEDRWAEDRIREVLLEAAPDSAVVGEERGEHLGNGVRWHVDPIDGTSNYATGIPFHCVSIGAEIDGHVVAGVVLDPVREEVFTGHLGEGTRPGSVEMAPKRTVSALEATLLTNFPYEGRPYGDPEAELFGELLRSFRTTRRLGSTALELAYVAAGRVDAAFGLGVNTWDLAGAVACLQAAGARFITPLGDGPEHWATGAVAYVGASPDLDLESTPLLDVIGDRRDDG